MHRPTEFWPSLAYRPYRSAEKATSSSPSWSISRLGDSPEDYSNVERSVLPRYKLQLSSLRDHLYSNKANAQSRIGQLNKLNDDLEQQIGRVQRAFELEMRAHMERPIYKRKVCS